MDTVAISAPISTGNYAQKFLEFPDRGGSPSAASAGTDTLGITDVGDD